MHPNQLEVLNISNVNGSGDVVINDEKLLELVQLYPLLYNPLAHGYQDPDYEDWAWRKLTHDFNKCYGSSFPEQPFSVSVLKYRWQMLLPIIPILSKSHERNAIPENLRGHVTKLALEMDRKSKEQFEPLGGAQALIHDNIAMVEQLPLEVRKCLEHEVISLLLTAELESQAAVKDYAVDVKKINQECTNLLTEIGLTVLPETLQNSSLNYLHHHTLDNMEMLRSNKQERIFRDPLKYTDYRKPIVYTSERVQLFQCPEQGLVIPKAEVTDDDVTTTFLNTESLLVPMGRPRWVPLNHASFHVRKCVVRVKRLPLLADDIPLARMKKELKW